jgi:hypothetical protein
LPVSGSRTWIWAIAAPALAASTAASAICFGVTGMAGCLSAVSPAPVTAQVMKASKFMVPFLARQMRPGSFLPAQAVVERKLSRRLRKCFRFPTGI